MSIFKRRLILFTITYIIDMSAGLAGFTFGFGLHVVSWWAVIGFMIVSRFLIHLLNNAMWAAVRCDREKETEV